MVSLASCGYLFPVLFSDVQQSLYYVMVRYDDFYNLYSNLISVFNVVSGELNRLCLIAESVLDLPRNKLLRIHAHPITDETRAGW